MAKKKWPRTPLGRLGLVLFLLCVLPGAAASLYIFIPLALNETRNSESKARLRDIMETLSIGDTKEDVRRVYSILRTARLKLNDTSNTRWSVSMPLELGATDWILWIDFSDDTVARLRIRESDSSAFMPDGAPADKGDTGDT